MGSTAWCQMACDLMAHRGPDGEGLYSDTQIVLGHRRLAIIDLSRGAQPMCYRDVWITFNGEIYNYRDLRRELQTLGFAFSTTSDTEVILAAYHAWGSESFRRLDGIFAFALWDAPRRQLYLVRDQLGVKPLLYHADAHGVRFASEIKALLAHPDVERVCDLPSLQEYLQLGYVLTPRSLIRGIRKLEPGTYLVIENEQWRSHSYWDLAQFASAPRQRLSEQAFLEEFEDRLSTTVRQQLVSDVPLGAFLSGGVDSSSVVAHAVAHVRGFNTFSIGFAEATFSELDYAEEAADILGTQHRQTIIEAPDEDELGRLVWYYDEPLGDTSLIPTYAVSRLAREHVTVSLSGDGGDELFAGYDTYRADQLQAVYRRLPRWIHEHAVTPLVNRIPATFGKVSFDFKLKQFVRYAYTNAEQAHYRWRLMFSPEVVSSLTGGAGAAHDPYAQVARHYEDVPHADALHRSLYVDIKTWLLDDILAKVDRASMACGLEARVPLLSPSFVEYAMRLPADQKLRGRTSKFLLKRSLRGRLPDRLIDRKKRGFNAPVSHWMRSRWRENFSALLQSGESTLIDTRTPLLTEMWQQHCSGTHDHGFGLWTVFSLLLWEQHVFQQVKQVATARS